MLTVFLMVGIIAPAVGAAAPTEDAADRARVVAAEMARIETIRRISPSVACLFMKGNHAGGGSGVIIDAEGFGLTNFHVVVGMLGDRKGEAGLIDGKLHEMEVLGIDPGGDVAMFKISEKAVLGHAPLGDSDTLQVGDYTMALGNPFGLADDYTPTVTLGIISGLHRYQPGVRGALVYTDCIQVDTSINPGNSGGPLFDLAGRVIGINGRISIEERSRVNVGVGFAITINQIKRFIPMLRAGLPTPHASAGFTVVDERDRVVIDRVSEDRPAYRAGLRQGDRLLQLGGREIVSANQFLSILGTYPAGWPVDVVHEREGRVMRFRMRLDALPLPKLTGNLPEGARPAADPYATHPVMNRANRMAVRRAIRRFRAAIGGDAIVAGVSGFHATGRRQLATAPEKEPEQIHWRVVLSEGKTADVPVGAAEIESSILGALLNTGESADREGYRVIAADEVRGRIAVVLRRQTADDHAYRVLLDDETGLLLAIEFRDEESGKSIRYEYGDERPVGGLRLPHTRWIYHDDEWIAEDRFEKVQILPKP